MKGKFGKPVPWWEAVELLLPVAKALAYAHSQNTIHQDVKAPNILLTDGGQPMLTDFGIVKILDAEETTGLTSTSAMLRTPEYMAPEQAITKTIDHRAGIYALGVVLYEMVTGRKPLVADTARAVLFKHASDPLPRPKQFVPNLPDDVERILLKALAKKPEDRYPSMAAMELAFVSVLGKKTRISILKQQLGCSDSSTRDLVPHTSIWRVVSAVGFILILVGVILSVVLEIFPPRLGAPPNKALIPATTATMSTAFASPIHFVASSTLNSSLITPTITNGLRPANPAVWLTYYPNGWIYSINLDTKNINFIDVTNCGDNHIWFLPERRLIVCNYDNFYEFQDGTFIAQEWPSKRGKFDTLVYAHDIYYSADYGNGSDLHKLDISDIDTSILFFQDRNKQKISDE